MILERENILSLIGSRRYHSAILTTFSFDFYFFEMKVMRCFRSCGIRNVNVLIDGHFYAELLKQNIGMEMQLAPGYSLYPMFQKGIFHPKVWMLLGEKESLLVVGSGNLTNAGNGNNDEIWGVFHFDVRQPDNAPLFASSWAYLQMLSSSIRGYTREKTTRWIIDHSPWLEQLPHVESIRFHKISNAENVAFLFNSVTSTIFDQLKSLIIDETIVELTLISPYYDVNGKAIKTLTSLFPEAKVNVVIDVAGLIPLRIPDPSVYSFFDWYTIGVSRPMKAKSSIVDTSSKLHAKIIHCKAKSGLEYLLFGSANISPEGLGLPGAIANAEAAVLFQSDGASFLEKLGITLKSSAKLSEFRQAEKQSIYDSIVKNNSLKIRLLSAEWVYDELNLYSEGIFSGETTVKLFNRHNEVLNSFQIDEVHQEMTIKLSTSLAEIHNVELYDARTDKPLSNKILLSNHYILAKTHPNPRNEAIEHIYSEIQNGELSRVLDLLPFALNDNTEGDTTRFASQDKSNPDEQDVTSAPSVLYDLSTYNHVARHSIEKGLLLSSLSLRVLDIVKFIGVNQIQLSQTIELRMDEQEEDLGTISGIDESELKVAQNKQLHTLRAERKKLIQYFDLLHDHQRHLLNIVRKNGKEKYLPTLTDLTRFMIALELMLEFTGKTEKYVDNNKEQTFVYLDLNGEAPFQNNNAKGICLNIIGDFLLLARSGFKEYDFEYTRTKIHQLKFEALTSSVICLLNLRWNESELPYLNTTLLNCLHYLGDKTTQGFENQWPNMHASVDSRRKSVKHSSGSYPENWTWFENRIVGAFKKTIKQLDAKRFDTKCPSGSIIYKSPWGYCFVKEVTSENDFTVSRPGFIWDNKFRDFVRHTNDEVYRPIRLPQFIQVHI